MFKVHPMGLFSKIFGGTPDGTDDAPDGEASAPAGHAQERPVSKSNAPDLHGQDAHGGAAPARITNGGTLVVNEQRPNNGAHPARAETPATQRGGASADRSARPAARPALSPNVEARVHTQAMHSSPTVTIKNTVDASAQQRPPARRGTGDVSPPPPPAQAGPPPKPAASRVPSPPVSKAPAKKVQMTATLPLGGNQTPAPPKSPGGNGVAQARAAEALELEPLGATAVAPRSSIDPDDVDNAFDRIAPAASVSPGLPGSLADDAATKAENAKLFSQMVVGHARPLREFMLDLTIGSTTKQWLDVTRPAADAILKGAVALEQKDLVSALSDLATSFQNAAKAAGAKIGKTDRSAIMNAYGKLVSLLPSAFEVKGDRDRREPLVVHHLLLQIPGVQKVTLDKLYAAGLASLESLCKASAEDLIAIGRVEVESAHAIVRRFQAYWRERAEEPLAKSEDRTKHKLRELVAGLAKAHTEFQEAEAAEDRERKRRARSERRERAAAMNVILAQLGEVDLVEELERSPTERRIERVQSYIEHSRASNP
jgi:hypothetical protein